MRTNKNFVGRIFKRFGVNLYFSPKKAKCVVCVFRNAILCAYPMIGLKRGRYQDILLKIQIPVCNCEEYTVWVWVFGPCYVNDVAFRGVEFHVPFMTPAFKVVKIFLEKDV